MVRLKLEASSLKRESELISCTKTVQHSDGIQRAYNAS